MSEILCKILGHNWRYKDYLNAMLPDGTPYPYTESRKCFRCNSRTIRINDGAWMEPQVINNAAGKQVADSLKLEE